MQCTKNTSKNTPSIRTAGSVRGAPRRALVRLTPLAHAVALLMAAGAAHGQQAFSPAWFAGKSVAQSGAVGSGRLPNGEAAAPSAAPPAQQQRAAGELQRSIGN
uniref:hypothetical protein n=1 Tax=Janthinobacterium sp. TaxID=1871054 RepID=UPI00293D44E8